MSKKYVSGNYELVRKSKNAYNTENEKQRRGLGKLLPHRIGQILKKLGYQTEIARGQSNGVDIKVWQNGNLILVAETKNYNMATKMTNDKKENAIRNLNEYPTARKVLIYTMMANEDILDDFKARGVSILKIGYQLMPWWFYYSLEKNLRDYRVIDSHESSLDIQYKLMQMLNLLTEEVVTPLDFVLYPSEESQTLQH